MELKEKVILVTGATSGIGKVAALELARRGAQVILVGRNEAKCQKTLEEIEEIQPKQRAQYLLADLSSMGEIRTLAQQVHERFERLDVLLNNAGAMFQKRIETVDGFEQTMALNHLSYFLLGNLLVDQLKETAKEQGEARIVNVSSGAHMGAPKGIPFDDFQAYSHYSGWRRYCESKLANLLFTYEFARRLDGSKVSVNALHPGFVRTHFAHNTGGWTKRLTQWGQNLFALSPEKGAETSIFLASSAEVKGVSGEYFQRKKRKKSSQISQNREQQERLWKLSQELTGLG